MLPLFPEYRVSHHRFKEHLRTAMAMSAATPLCAFVLYHQLGWWNPWLWGCCGVGVALALMLYSTVLIHRTPRGLTPFSRRLVETSPDWFPYFFVILQSLSVALIILFIWFSTTSLALKVPLYVHVMLVVLVLMIPLRRYRRAKAPLAVDESHEKWDEILRALWHILGSIFIARCIIGLTVEDVWDASIENIAWQILIWVPAATYIVYTALMTFYHFVKINPSVAQPRAPVSRPREEEPIDRF